MSCVKNSACVLLALVLSSAWVHAADLDFSDLDLNILDKIGPNTGPSGPSPRPQPSGLPTQSADPGKWQVQGKYNTWYKTSSSSSSDPNTPIPPMPTMPPIPYFGGGGKFGHHQQQHRPTPNFGGSGGFGPPPMPNFGGGSFGGGGFGPPPMPNFGGGGFGGNGGFGHNFGSSFAIPQPPLIPSFGGGGGFGPPPPNFDYSKMFPGGGDGKVNSGGFNFGGSFR